MKFLKKDIKREAVVELDENGNPIEKEKKSLSKKAKVAIAVAATAVVTGAGYVVYTKVLKKTPDPETVKEVAEAVNETVEEVMNVTEEVVEAVV